MSNYANGVACEQGHWITRNTDRPGTPFCGMCGSAAVDRCSNCNKPLRGEYVGGAALRPPPPLSFCQHCGQAWPWTKAQSDAFLEMASAVEELTGTEIDNLRELLPHIVTQGPRTEVAAFKIATIVSRVKGPSLSILKDILSNLAVEAAKKNLGL